jgi:hypothetical protein
MAYTAQHAVRVVNQMRRGESREVRRATVDAFIRRLATRRRRRIAEWNNTVGSRPGGIPSQMEQ